MPKKPTSSNDERLKVIFQAVRAPEEHVTALRALSDSIARAVTEKWGGNVLIQAFGSCIAGCALASSDVDLNLQVNLKGAKLVTVLNETASLVSAICPGAEIEVIAGAKVPVIKAITAESGLHLDIVLNSPNGVEVTRAVRDLLAIDSRAAPLVVVLKHWAQNTDLNSSRDHTLSSHAWTCLMIAYLQRRDPPVLPLVPWRLHGNLRLETALEGFAIGANKESVASLLAGFFPFYADEFSLWSLVVDLRDLKKRRKATPTPPQPHCNPYCNPNRTVTHCNPNPTRRRKMGGKRRRKGLRLRTRLTQILGLTPVGRTSRKAWSLSWCA